jgi:hypothetical protein
MHYAILNIIRKWLGYSLVIEIGGYVKDYLHKCPPNG